MLARGRARASVVAPPLPSGVSAATGLRRKLPACSVCCYRVDERLVRRSRSFVTPSQLLPRRASLALTERLCCADARAPEEVAEDLVDQLCALDVAAGGASRLSRDVAAFILASHAGEERRRLLALPWEALLARASEGICIMLAREEQAAIVGLPLPLGAPTAPLLARCARQLADVGLARLPCAQPLFLSLLSAVLRRDGRTGVRAAAGIGALEDVCLRTLAEQLHGFLLRGLEHEARQSSDEVGTAAGAGWWSVIAVRVERMRISGLFSESEGEAILSKVREEVIARLPRSSLGEIVQTWKRLRRSSMDTPTLTAAVGEALKDSLEHSPGSDGFTSRGLPWSPALADRVLTKDFVNALGALADLGWRCPAAIQLDASQEQALLAPVAGAGSGALAHCDSQEDGLLEPASSASSGSGTLATCDVGRLGVLAEVSVAVAFPSEAAPFLLRALSVEVVSRRGHLTLRNAVDVGIRLAFAGVATREVFDVIGEAARKAVSSGKRLKPQWAACAAARLAICGIEDPGLYQALASAQDGVTKEDTCKLWPEEVRAFVNMSDGSFGRFSELPLLHLVRYNRRAPKVAKPPEGTCEVPGSISAWACGGPSDSFFEDPTKPLIVDLGCARGMWLLQLFCQGGAAAADFNGLGVDTSPRLLAYPRGIATRSQVNARLQFVVGSAEEAIRRLESYPGPVAIVAAHFPTPYALPGHGSDGRGNAQLPVVDDFMVGLPLLQELARLRGVLLFAQTDSEDVALHMRRAAEGTGALRTLSRDAFCRHLASLGCVAAPPPALPNAVGHGPRSEAPLRAARAGAALPLEGWLGAAVLPPCETEARCVADGRAVLRYAALAA